MTHQVIAFSRSARREAGKTASSPLSSPPANSLSTATNRTVALTIALRYLATRSGPPRSLAANVPTLRTVK